MPRTAGTAPGVGAGFFQYNQSAHRPRPGVHRAAPRAGTRSFADAQRQRAQDRLVRRQLFVRARRHDGTRALERQLAGQPQACTPGGRGRNRLSVADRALEIVRAARQLPGGDARDDHLGHRSVGGDAAHHRVWNRACPAVQSDHGRQADGHRRPHRRGPVRTQRRRWVERGRVRDVRRAPARSRGALRLRPGMARRRQVDLVILGQFRFRRDNFSPTRVFARTPSRSAALAH